MRYLYRLKDPITNAHRDCEYEPEGWGEYGVTFGRETGISNVVKGYVSSWKFVKSDARWLRKRLLAHGPNRRLVLSVYDLNIDMCTDMRLIYEGDIDLTQAAWDDSTFSAPTSEGGFFKALENCWDRKVETPLTSYVQINGAVFGESSDIGDLGDMNGYVSNGGETSLLFIVPTNIKNNSRMNEHFLNDVELAKVMPVYPNSVYVSSTLDALTSMSAGHSFFYSNVQRIEKLRIDYNIQMHCQVNHLGWGGNHDRLICFHRLSIYGIPKVKVDNSVNNVYLRYEVDTMGDASVQPSDRQYYREIQVCREDVENQKKNSKGIYCDYNPKFSGSFTIVNMDTGVDGGMYFFLVAEVHLGYAAGAVLTPSGVNTTPNTNMRQVTTDTSSVKFSVYRNDTSASYDMVINQNRIVSAVKSTEVFRTLMRSVAGNRYNIDLDMSEFDRLAYNDLLTCGDGLRRSPVRLRGGLSSVHGAIVTSLGDFLKYAYAVYGLTMGVRIVGNRYNVFLAPYELMYERNTTIGRITEYAGLGFELERGLLYTRIRIGYENDSEMYDGKNEYNCEQTWRTPNYEIEENEIDMVSSYSASSKSIETYTFENYDEPSSTTIKDTDVYIICGVKIGLYAAGTQYEGDLYILDKSYEAIGGVDYPKSQWNLKYTPKRMLASHRVELNSYFALDEGSQIVFDTCDYNCTLISQEPMVHGLSPVVIREGSPLQIGSNRVFVPILAKFNAKADRAWIHAIESNRLGVIKFNYNGVDVRGYIADGAESVSINPIRPSASEFTLLLIDTTGLQQ